MKIRKFRAKSFQEGKEKIFSELGPEAIILSTRVIPPVPPEFEELVELVAATDTENDAPPTFDKDIILSEKTKGTKENSGSFLELTSNIYKEISTIKNFLYDLSDKITYRFISELPSEMSELAKLMMKNGFSTEFTLSLVNSLSKKNITTNDLVNFANKVLSERLQYVGKFPNNETQNIILFVGPTGSGKTINIAKLGVLFKVLLSARICLVSFDYRKIGGWEQMQMLSAVTGLNTIFCQTKEELKEQINLLKSYDFILVDTSGGSPRDEEFINELEEISGLINWTSIILVLSVTQSALNFKRCIESFRVCKPNFLMLTKFDEVTTIGHIYQTLLEVVQEIPLLYFSIGVDIPNSIEPASPELLQKFLINSIY